MAFSFTVQKTKNFVAQSGCMNNLMVRSRQVYLRTISISFRIHFKNKYPSTYTQATKQNRQTYVQSYKMRLFGLPKLYIAFFNKRLSRAFVNYFLSCAE